MRLVNRGRRAAYALAKRQQKKPDRYIPTIGARPLTGVGSGAPLKKLVGDGKETVPQHLRNRATSPAQPGCAVQVGNLRQAIVVSWPAQELSEAGFIESRAGWQPTERPMSAFCVFGMTEPLAKTLAARKAPPRRCGRR